MVICRTVQVITIDPSSDASWLIELSQHESLEDDVAENELPAVQETSLVSARGGGWLTTLSQFRPSGLVMDKSVDLGPPTAEAETQ